MNLASRRTHDVFRVNSTNQQGIGDERTMTAPRNRFGAHQDTTFGTCQVRDPLNVVGELWRLHVVGIAPKREIVPAGIGRIGPRMT